MGVMQGPPTECTLQFNSGCQGSGSEGKDRTCLCTLYVQSPVSHCSQDASEHLKWSSPTTVKCNVNSLFPIYAITKAGSGLLLLC